MRHSFVSLRCSWDARCEVASATAFLSSSAGTASHFAHFFATASQYALSNKRFLGGIFVAGCRDNRYLAGICFLRDVSGSGRAETLSANVRCTSGDRRAAGSPGNAFARSLVQKYRCACRALKFQKLTRGPRGAIELPARSLAAVTPAVGAVSCVGRRVAQPAAAANAETRDKLKHD